MVEKKTASIGVEPLERIFGGLCPGDVCLISGGADTGKTVAALQFVLEGLKNEETVAWVTSTQPEQLVAAAAGLRLPISGYIKTKQLILLHQKTQASAVIQGDGELAMMVSALEHEILPWEPKRLVIDSAVALINLFQADFRRSAVSTLFGRFSELELKTLLTTRMPASTEALGIRKLLEELSACSLHLDEQRRADGETRRRLVVRKLQGVPPPHPVYEFQIEAEQGLCVSAQSETGLDLPQKEEPQSGKRSVNSAAFLFSKDKMTRQNFAEASEGPPEREKAEGDLTGRFSFGNDKAHDGSKESETSKPKARSFSFQTGH